MTLYWLTRSAGSATYVVYAADAGAWGEQPATPTQPVGAIMFAHDIGIEHLAERTSTSSTGQHTQRGPGSVREGRIHMWNVDEGR